MRLGAHVYGYRDAEEWAALHVQYGYGAAYWPLPHTAEKALEEEFAAAARRHGLVISEVGAWNNLLHRDPAQREKNIRDTIACLKLADRVGARCCVNITGSYADTWDGPHPANLTEETFREVVAITRRIIDEAAPQHTFYTAEPMPWLYPNSIGAMQRLLDAVDRPQFAVHVDMCNLINSFDNVYRTGEYTRAFFAAFGPRIQAVHAKDIRIAGKLTLQIYETPPGEGVFDHAALLRECSKLSPDLPVMAEHLEGPMATRRAASFFAGQAQALGLEVVKGY